jgi:hypothetical protein
VKYTGVGGWGYRDSYMLTEPYTPLPSRYSPSQLALIISESIVIHLFWSSRWIIIWLLTQWDKETHRKVWTHYYTEIVSEKKAIVFLFLGTVAIFLSLYANDDMHMCPWVRIYEKKLKNPKLIVIPVIIIRWPLKTESTNSRDSN